MTTKKILFGVALTLLTVATSVTVIYRAAVQVAAEEAEEKASNGAQAAAEPASTT